MLSGTPKNPRFRAVAASLEPSPAGDRQSAGSSLRDRLADAAARGSPQRNAGRRASGIFGSPMRRPNSGGSSGSSTPGRIRLSAEEQRRSFDEWMKIAADNKINASNSWNLALIDYFYDMTLLREGNSINFQKASCTLDGCVKIYTSRVDSVDSETKKLLSGLVSSNTQTANEAEAGSGDEGEEGGEGGEVQKKKKRAHRATNTLEKDINNLNVKKFDLEFNVDPLFKKTSADFDEGGAHGLLLNHLSISKEGRIIFDASDVGVMSGEADLLEGEEANEAPSSVTKEDSQRVDIRGIKERFKDRLANLWNQEICAPLRDFEFGSSGSDFVFNLPDSNGDGDAFAGSTKNNAWMNDFDDDGDDFGGGGEGYDDQYISGDGLADKSANFEHIANMSFVEGAGGDMEASGGMGFADNASSMFSYFDAAMIKSWAGPEHWRSRPLIRDKSGKEASGVVRKKKAVVSLDFLNPESQPNEARLFAAATTSILLPKQQERTKITHLLPDDMHFSSKELLRLFLKPKYKIRLHRRAGPANAHTASTDGPADGPMDEQFWAEHEPLPESNLDQDNGPDTHHDDHSPFDDDPDSDVDDEIDDTLISSGDISASQMVEFGDNLVDQPRKVRAVPLNYARVAKKVDVKRLKENIWREMVVQEGQSIDDNPLNPPPESAVVSGPKSFKKLIRGLDNLYTEKKRKDISVAFCFICVLHLANEQGLVIQQGAPGTMEEKKRLSELQILPGVAA
ncbi:condensin complex component cnd2 [Phlyctochytrium arcticum]|nr:condensin complex component cnd2 [Phlyctochytrium arcticum]